MSYGDLSNKETGYSVINNSHELKKCCSDSPQFLITYLNDSTWTLCKDCFNENYFSQNIKTKRTLS